MAADHLSIMADAQGVGHGGRCGHQLRRDDDGALVRGIDPAGTGDGLQPVATGVLHGLVRAHDRAGAGHAADVALGAQHRQGLGGGGNRHIPFAGELAGRRHEVTVAELAGSHPAPDVLGDLHVGRLFAPHGRCHLLIPFLGNAVSVLAHPPGPSTWGVDIE